MEALCHFYSQIKGIYLTIIVRNMIKFGGTNIKLKCF